MAGRDVKVLHEWKDGSDVHQVGQGRDARWWARSRLEDGTLLIWRLASKVLAPELARLAAECERLTEALGRAQRHRLGLIDDVRGLHEDVGAAAEELEHRAAECERLRKNRANDDIRIARLESALEKMIDRCQKRPMAANLDKEPTDAR